ncbi:MAG: hypothetical protein J3R72DRAFT_452620 [Linnemannia gamsii]|nr:MAG: hypothetical protein J3R72DRAFT_452620 [Linnemannia gamsii]
MCRRNSSRATEQQRQRQPFPSRTRHSLSILTIATTVLLSSTSVTTTVQAQAPIPVCCMAYSSTEGTLFIQGGLSATGATRTKVDQFMGLDLTLDTWSTSNPPWRYFVNTQLPNTPFTPAPSSSYHSMATARDQDNLFVWDPTQEYPWYTYEFKRSYWNRFQLTNLTVTQKPGVRNGVDPNTSLVYFPAGNNNGLGMFSNEPGKPPLYYSDMPVNLMPDPVIHESFVWSSYQKGFLHYGGRTISGNKANPYLHVFLPPHSWGRMDTSGTSPGDVSGHCMVPAYGGSKMIVFGGHDLDGVAKADIYFYDPSTREWTTGKAADPAQARTNMACVVVGDSFIAWGGENGQNITDNIPIVYDMKNNQWTTQFNSVITTSTSSESKANAAAIGGGIAGAVVVVALVGFLFYRRRNSRQNSNINSSDRSESGNRFTTGTNNKNDDDAVGLSARDPQDTGGDYKRASYSPSGIPSPVPPMLKLRQTDDRGALYGHLVTHPLKTPLAGPHSVMRDPQGNDQPQQMLYFSPETSESKAEWSDDSSNNISHPSPPPIPARPSHIRDLKNTTADVFQTYSIDEGDSRSVQPYETSPPQTLVSPRFPRSPQTPTSGHFGEQQTGGVTIGGP